MVWQTIKSGLNVVIGICGYKVKNTTKLVVALCVFIVYNKQVDFKSIWFYKSTWFAQEVLARWFVLREDGQRQELVQEEQTGSLKLPI